MTVQHQKEMAYTAQQLVIDTLQSTGNPDLAARLERCMTARRVLSMLPCRIDLHGSAIRQSL